MSNKGTLFLIPTVIADGTQANTIPMQVKNTLPGIQFFLAEDVRTARRYLSSLKVYETVENLNFSVLDKHTQREALAEFFSPVLKGLNLGIISESGCPGVADPGALAVQFAHEQGIRVVPLVGPSSILLALMSSGLNGQRFCFHGYLPIDASEAKKSIRELEKESRTKHQTQIFIETPYRNNTMAANLLKHLDEQTQLCIAVDLTGDNENIATKSIKKWRSEPIELPKKPAIFLFLA